MEACALKVDGYAAEVFGGMLDVHLIFAAFLMLAEEGDFPDRAGRVHIIVEVTVAVMNAFLK